MIYVVLALCSASVGFAWYFLMKSHTSRNETAPQPEDCSECKELSCCTATEALRPVDENQHASFLDLPKEQPKWPEYDLMAPKTKSVPRKAKKKPAKKTSKKTPKSNKKKRQ